jgi:uncharacterized protein (UPF0303 family)
MTISDDLACIERQENTLWFERFSEAEAWQLGCQLRDWGVEQGAPVVIDVRFFERPLFYAALPGSVPDNREWVRRKSNVVARFHRSSYGIGLKLKQDGVTLEQRYGVSFADYAAHGGSFPVLVRGVGPVGSVTVSGLPQRDDHALVVRALCELQGRTEAELALPPPE